MQIKFVINGVDFAPYIKAGGIQYSPVYRSEQSVVVLDGTLFKASVGKRGMSVSLVELRDSTLSRLAAAIEPLSTVLYTEKDGQDRERLFYVDGPTWTAKTVVGGNTYYNGVSLSLEER